jgi:hypothetical protein
MTDPQDEAKKPVTVVCEKHGLRYNPQVHSGCVRCRKEAGEAIGGAAKAAAGTSARQGGSIAAALAVTVLLVVLSSGLFYAIHRSAWDAAREAREQSAAVLRPVELVHPLVVPAEDEPREVGK